MTNPKAKAGGAQPEPADSAAWRDNRPPPAKISLKEPWRNKLAGILIAYSEGGYEFTGNAVADILEVLTAMTAERSKSLSPAASGTDEARPDFNLVGALIEAHQKAMRAGLVPGTTNWGAMLAKAIPPREAGARETVLEEAAAEAEHWQTISRPDHKCGDYIAGAIRGLARKPSAPPEAGGALKHAARLAVDEYFNRDGSDGSGFHDAMKMLRRASDDQS